MEFTTALIGGLTPDDKRLDAALSVQDPKILDLGCGNWEWYLILALTPGVTNGISQGI